MRELRAIGFSALSTLVLVVAVECNFQGSDGLDAWIRARLAEMRIDAVWMSLEYTFSCAKLWERAKGKGLEETFVVLQGGDGDAPLR